MRPNEAKEEQESVGKTGGQSQKMLKLVIQEGSNLGVRRGLPRWLSGKKNPDQAGGLGSVPESGRPLEKHGNPLQCSYLGSAMDREAWRATVHGFIKSWTQLMD